MIIVVILAAVMVVLSIFFWPAAVTPVVMMKAPGATGWFVSRAAFQAFPKLYFLLLRYLGGAAAGFVFCGMLPQVVAVLALVLTVAHWYWTTGTADDQSI